MIHHADLRREIALIKRSLEAFLADVDPVRTPDELGKELFGADQGSETAASVGYKRRLETKLRAKHHR